MGWTSATLIVFLVSAAAGVSAGKKEPPPVTVCITANVPTQPGGFVDPAVVGPFDEDLGNVRLFLGHGWRPMIKEVDRDCRVAVVVEARGSKVVDAPADAVVEAGADRKYTVQTVQLTVKPTGGEAIPVWGHGLDHTLACAKPLATHYKGYDCSLTGYWQVAARGATDYVGEWIRVNYKTLVPTAR